MTWLLFTLFVLWVGWKAYIGAKAAGTWSNKVFFGILGGSAVLIAIIAVPINLIPQSTLQAHFGLTLFILLFVITAGVVEITIYANRWWKRVLLERAGQNPSDPVGPK
jgi:hypothetical protein